MKESPDQAGFTGFQQRYFTMRITLENIVRSDRLPSLPQVALRVVELAGQPEPDLHELCQVIQSDPALCGKILRTVNSALFGLRGGICSMELAVARLGVTLVRTIVLSFSLAESQACQQQRRSTLHKFWRSSLAQAVIAEALATRGRRAGDSAADDATYFLAGLLQSIGLLAIWRVVPEEYEEQVLENSTFPAVAAAEQQVFGFTHLEVGRHIWQRWGLPDDLVEAMAEHQNLVVGAEQTPPSHLARSLKGAHLFARYLETAFLPGQRQLDLFSCYLFEQFGFDAEETEHLIQEACLRIAELAAMFAFDLGRPIDTERLMNDAREALAEIALQAQLAATSREPQPT